MPSVWLVAIIIKFCREQTCPKVEKQIKSGKVKIFEKDKGLRNFYNYHK